MVITTCNTDFGVLSLRCTDDQYERLKKYNIEISDIVESYRAKKFDEVESAHSTSSHNFAKIALDVMTPLKERLHTIASG